MMISRWMRPVVAAMLPLAVAAVSASAQGVTTSAISARVVDASGNPKQLARVVAVHTPSGTTYEGRTRPDGRVTIPGMRVGGPYKVTATNVGFEPDVKDNIFLSLGVATELNFVLRTAAVQLSAVTVTGASESVFSHERTGAATAVPREAIQTLPTITGRMEDFIRLTPQYSGSGFGFSFAGQDNRMNNVTIDGSYFNNSFGLAGQPGDRTGVAPISMDAIEQVQVNIAPYDVRQGNFIGAGVNTVTRSGTNELTGSVYYSWRNNQRALHGTTAMGQTVNPGKFKFSKLGVSVGGPIIKNKLFFFANYEDDGLTSPGTTFLANTGGQPVAGNTTRVLKTDLDALSTYLKTNFNYDPGTYEGYDFQTPATRYLAKLDYNISERNKLSFRYNQLDSYTDVLASNSSSLGFGNRRTNSTGLNFSNSNYQILENIKSGVGELNTVVGSNMANNLIVGYEHHDESRGYKTQCPSFATGAAADPNCFPFVDILQTGSVYTSFGFEPFTPNNELRYGSWQFQDNFTYYTNKHDFTVGVSAEKYHSENVFFQGAQSVYTYNSLADFYADANGYLANPNRTVSPVTLNKFEVGYTNIPGQTKPIQPLDVVYAGIYGQDQFRFSDKLSFTLGLRVDRPTFDNGNAFLNPQVDTAHFRDENGATVQYSTAKLPNANLLFSPRFGFNWDVTGDRSTQVRGGTGVFTGRPAYVWISNQIGNNGVITGFERLTSTTARPFNPDPSAYKPATVTGAPAASYALALTDADFKFPQLWRSNIGVDRKLPWGMVGTGEFLYSRDVNGMYYINANLPAPDANYAGPDTRPRWNVDKCPTVSGNQFDRLGGNCIVSNAVVLKNSNGAYSWNTALTLEKPFGLGTYVKAAYNYGVAKSYVDPGSIASGSWTGNAVPGNPNNPPLSYAATSPGHRFFAAASKRMDIFKLGGTTAALFWEWRTIANASYTFSGDVNGDGSTNNDLIYIPKDKSEMNFVAFTSSGVTFTPQQQADAWEAYIEQDDYLSSRRGKYAERNAVFFPMFNRADFSLTQDVASALTGRKNSLQLRLDFLNFGNLLNHNWGVSQRMVNTQPLIFNAAASNTSGQVSYTMRNIGTKLMDHTFEQTATTGDVYRIQLSVRYLFQ